MTLKTSIVLTLSLLVSSQVFAGQSTSGYWAGVFPIYQLSSNQTLLLQAEARRVGDQSFRLFRPLYHYKMKNWLILGIGGDLFTTENTESRYWQEFNLVTPTSIWGQKTLLRVRQEWRHLSGEENSGARTRIMLLSQFDILKSQRLEAFVFNEIFYTQRSFSKQRNFYDRNWLGVRFRKHVNDAFIDLGVFWEKVFSAENTEGTVGILSVGYFFK